MDKKEMIKYIVAFTYGDGYIGKHGKECRFEANNVVDNRDYIEWRASILRNLTEVNLHECPGHMMDGCQRKNFIHTTTRTNPLYTIVHSRLYLDGKKVFDPHYLKLFDWETLAILYMDDGSLRDVKHYYKGDLYDKHTYTPNLATCCFSYADNLLLKKAIKENLGIEFNINKHGVNQRDEQTYILNLLQSSYIRFMENITPFILPSFQYKIRMVGSPIGDEDTGRSVEKSTETSRND